MLLPVSDFLLADSAGLLLCNDTFNLLVEDSLLLHLKPDNRKPRQTPRRDVKLLVQMFDQLQGQNAKTHADSSMSVWSLFQ